MGGANAAWEGRIVAADTTPDRESRSSDEIFPLLSEECRRDVVMCALQHRAATKNVRQQLKANVRRLPVDGFRDPSRAPHHRLLRPVLEAIERRDHPLARAVLNAWMECRDTLRDAAAAHLASRGIPVPEPPDACFESFWTIEEWLRERAALSADDDAVDREAAGLMLCLLSRRFPAPPPLASPLLCGWLDELHELPPDAPEWAEAEAFTKWVHDVRRAKRRELFGWCKAEIARACEDIRTRFDEDLRYLELDPDPWPDQVESRPGLAAPALQLLNTLRDHLEAYQPLRPQAASRDQELDRSEQRREREVAIYTLLSDWIELQAQPEPPEEPAAEPDDLGEATAVDDPVATGSEDQQAFDRLKEEHDQPPPEIGALRAESDRLHHENQALQADRAQRDQEIDRLRDELSRSRRTEEQWRRAYVDERRRPHTPEADDPVAVENVRDAIDLAGKTFPDRLLLKLNSKSKPDTAFENPGEVFDVLAWLATAYRNAPPETFEEACPGWFYRANQSETTMGRFRDWYRTRVDGTTWKLSNHVGKGTSHDPRHTIRIAFAWDESNERVIVGFVGVHQRNRQS